MAPVHAATQAGEYLVGDRTGYRGPFLRIRLAASRPSEQHHLVAEHDGCVSDIDQKLIHRDRSDDWMTHATDHHLATV